MPFTANGKHYAARAKRWCKRCGRETEQDMVMNRMRCTPQPIVPLTYIREQEWYCTQCDNIEELTKEVTEPTDKARIFNRLLRIPEGYDVLGVSITSEADGITFKIRLPDYDMGELRAVQHKQRETGFITVQELATRRWWLVWLQWL